MDNGTPLVSIVIPVFNKADLTLACLTSVAEHTDEVPYEVVVVDNGSTDHTAQVLGFLGGDVTVIRNPDNRGFGEACNQGAAAARGRYVLFLNNDTLCLPGWLPPLVQALDEDPRRAAVQPRLLYPDGRLNDAGGLVFAGGEAWVYGKGSPYPDSALFVARRAPDYASGACLLVRAEAFREVGGFDPRYAPAYYEDTDLSFALRAAGWTLLYEPRSTIVHVEGGTAGTDTSTGLKAYQVRNKALFAAKWAGELARRPVLDPARVEDWANRPLAGDGPGEGPASATTGRSILVIDPYPPMYDRASGSLRLLQVVRCLREAGHAVTWYCAGDAPERRRYADVLGRIGVVMYGVQRDEVRTTAAQAAEVRAAYRPELANLLARRHFDDVLVGPWNTAEYVLPILRAGAPHARIVVDTCDVHFLREQREAALAGTEPLSGDPADPDTPAGKARREVAVYRAADRVVCVSEADAAALRAHLRAGRLAVVGNAHDDADPGPGHEARDGLLFVGNANHPPNVDAVSWWAEQIAPRLAERLPGVRLTVVGNDPGGRFAAFAGPHVEVVGWVPEVTPYLHAARLSVAPLRYGAGVKGKVGEALMAGLPVVATPVAVEGMGIVDREHALVAADADGLVDAVVGLYADRPRWERLRAAGVAHARASLGLDAMRRALDELFGAAAAGGRPAYLRHTGHRAPAGPDRSRALCVTGTDPAALAGVDGWLAAGGVVVDTAITGIAEPAARAAAVVDRQTRDARWGWVDACIVHALDGWRGGVGGLKVLGLWQPCRPAVGGDTGAVAAWLEAAEALLDFAHRHPADALVLPRELLQTDPHQVRALLIDAWGLALDPADAPPAPAPGGPAVVLDAVTAERVAAVERALVALAPTLPAAETAPLAAAG